MIHKSSPSPSKLIVLLSMIYISIFFASITVGYKIVAFGHELFCASILIFPLLFPLSDAFAEIYGTKIAKSMIWYTILCEFIFAALTNMAIRLPSPPNWHHQAAYDFIVGGYIHILLANATALWISFILNVTILNRWRILLKGKHYYFRSLGATAIGEISYTIITNLIAYTHVLPWQDIANIIFSDYFAKMIYSAVIAYPGALFVTYVKMKQGHHLNTVFNPFGYKTNTKIVNLFSYKKTN